MSARRRPLVAIIGNSSAPAPVLEAAQSLGSAVIDAGWRIVCGGMGGVMEAACKGGRESSKWQDGDTIGLLPWSDANEANPYVDISIPTGIGLARNAIVASAGDAVVAVAGGSGTLCEIAYAWQFNKPLLALDIGVGWSSELAGRQLDDRRDDQIARAANVSEVITWLQGL